MSNSEKTLVTVATYNEMENLPLLVDAIFEQLPEAHVLVIDDGSPDGTGDWVDERAKEDGRVHCIHREGKLGLGTAIIAGMRYGIEHGYRYVLNMDADFSHHPRYLPNLVAGMDPEEGEGVDVMIGSRYVPGGGVEGWPFKRHFMSRGVNMYARLMLGIKSRDCSGSYRCYRTTLLEKIDFDAIRSRGYSFQEEILFHLRRAGARFGETPIVFADRERGESKIDSKEAVSALWVLFRIGLSRPFR
ncbi:MAG: polyprenol monophosphomannose synthase [Planctomycetia bacterium]|jgi:dolichol-phosphate mannosyltransferase